MEIAGIDFSTHFVDVVLLDENTDAATWHRFELSKRDSAFDRSRSVRYAIPGPSNELWDDVLAFGIEDPRGYGAGSLYRIQGAILACLPPDRLVHPLIPSHWRKVCGMKGNASKAQVADWVFYSCPSWDNWPQDACDAYCIALATRHVLEHKEAA